MAAASCYGCAHQWTVFQNPQGVKDSPYGVCKNCSALFCGYHGVRKSRPVEFLCSLCGARYLASCGVTQAPATAPLSTQQRAVIDEIASGYHLFSAPVPPERWRVENVQQFLAGVEMEPGIMEDFFRDLGAVEVTVSKFPPEFAGIWEYLPSRAKELMVASFLLVRKLRLPLAPEAEYLARVYQAMELPGMEWQYG